MSPEGGVTGPQLARCVTLLHSHRVAMCRRLLALNALRAFEVAARHRSLTKAAEELAVTPAAVHHQVKSLEALLGVSLLVRSGNGIALSKAATAVLPALEAAFDLLALATEQVRQHGSGGVLSVACCPSFAQKWLLPRLERFRQSFEGIELRITSASELPDLANSEVDLAVAYGAGSRVQSAAVQAEHLLDDEVFPVCSPEYGRRHDGLVTEGELLSGVLLHDDGALAEQGADWDSWLSSVGAGPSSLAENIRFDTAAMAIEAAVAGQGVALARSCLVGGDLAAGRLLRPFARGLSVSGGYFVTCLNAVAEQPNVVAFREWLFAEASRDRLFTPGGVRADREAHA